MKKIFKTIMATISGKSQQSTQESANKNDNSNSYNYEYIENTPFIHVKDDIQGWYIVMGDTRITEPTKNKHQSLKQIEDINWKTLTVVIATIVQKVLDKRKEEATTELEKKIDEIQDKFTTTEM
jgi:hypothetical protein